MEHRTTYASENAVRYMFWCVRPNRCRPTGQHDLKEAANAWISQRQHIRVSFHNMCMPLCIRSPHPPPSVGLWHLRERRCRVV